MGASSCWQWVTYSNHSGRRGPLRGPSYGVGMIPWTTQTNRPLTQWECSVKGPFNRTRTDWQGTMAFRSNTGVEKISSFRVTEHLTESHTNCPHFKQYNNSSITPCALAGAQASLEILECWGVFPMNMWDEWEAPTWPILAPEAVQPLKGIWEAKLGLLCAL